MKAYFEAIYSRDYSEFEREKLDTIDEARVWIRERIKKGEYVHASITEYRQANDSERFAIFEAIQNYNI